MESLILDFLIYQNQVISFDLINWYRDWGLYDIIKVTGFRKALTFSALSTVVLSIHGALVPEFFT